MENASIDNFIGRIRFPKVIKKDSCNLTDKHRC